MNNIEKHLNNLGKMLKKRENPAFGSDLRNELLRRANVMNTAKVEHREQNTESRWGFAINPFMKKVMATATAFALLVAVVTYSLLPGGGGQVVELVNIAEAQDYYTLTPIAEDTSGVNAEEGFLLESKGAVDAGEVEDALVITPDVEIEVEQISDTSVEIVPSEPLAEGEVYAIELNAQDMESSPYKTEYSWAYQVSDKLRIAGTLPSDRSTEVPIDTGIEINFNFNGMKASDFANYYSIEPAVTGGWDSKGKTAVFIPSDNLAEMTIYTVTIKAGLLLNGSDKTLTEDYTFQFETSGESRDTANVNFSKDFYNYGVSEDKIAMQVYYWTDYWYDDSTTSGNPTVSLQVYSYRSGDDFASAVTERQDNSISWSYYSNDYSSSIEGLDLIIDAPETPLVTSMYDSVMELPQVLGRGYYLVKISMGGTEKETFLQVSDLATYVSLSSNKSLVWVNDLSTGQPVAGASVEVLGMDSAETDSDGVAEFDRIFPEIESYDEEDTSEGLISVLSGETVAYYPYDYWNSYSNNDYWQFFETERETYHPTDKIYYWGFLKGREDSVKGDAQLIVTNQTWVWDAKYLAENDSIFYSEDIEIKDGEVFKGSVDIDTFAPGYYALEIVSDDKVIATASFSVEDFIKPAYEITVEPEKSFLFSGESTNVNVTAEFFEGTPVSNLELSAAFGNKGSYGESDFVTDDNGKTSIEYTADNNLWCEAFSYCELFYTDGINVTPINEEEGYIYGEARVTTINSLVGAQEISVDYDEALTLQTRYVDIEKVEAETGWLSSWNDVYGDMAPNMKVVATVLKREQIKTEIGQYYDYINKVTRTQYEYSEVDVSTDTYTLYTDAEGNLNYDLGLDSAYLYQVDIAIYDENENYYRWQTYLYPHDSNYDWYYYNNYYTLDGVEDSYDVGSPVAVSVISSNEETDMTGYNYLYLQSRDGTSSYETSGNSSYSFGFTDEMIPNITVSAVVFDGEGYADVSSGYARYNYENERLSVEISADKDSYEPGDEVTLDVKISDKSSVNLYLVDEAYYSLFAESVTDPLEQLYGTINDGVLYRYSSSEVAEIDFGGKGGCFRAGTPILMADGTTKNIEDIEIGDKISTRVSHAVNDLVSGNVVKTYEHYVGEYLLVNGSLGVTDEHIMFINGQWDLASSIVVGDVLIGENGERVVVESVEKISEPSWVYNFEVEKYHTYFADGIYVHNDKGGTRSVLKDTALFEVVETDSGGNASVTFILPDNITSWKVVASAINGEKLEAGLGTANIDVTRPVIVLPVINSEYLIGDQPSIPVRAYGDYLTADMFIRFGMESEDLSYEETADGVAYKNTYFDLGALTTEGRKEITTWAENEAGDEGDSLLLSTNVVASHFAINKIWSSVLSEGTKLEGSSDKRTEVSFMNAEVGAFYGILVGSAYNSGDRADQMAVKFVAQKLLSEYFGKDEFEAWEFPTFSYQDGGIALLNYDSSRLELSAKLAALDRSLWDEHGLKSYFESFLLSATEMNEKGYYVEETEYTLNEKIMAIYGLAALDENYLNELNYLVSNNELELADKIFATLAYLQFGAKDQAEDLYLDIMQNYAEADSDYIVVNDDGVSLDNKLSWTALTAVIAAEIGDDNEEKLFKFVSENDVGGKGRAELVDIEKMLYAKALLDMGADATVSFKLNGEKITLEGSDVYTVSMLPEEFASVSFSSISGEIEIVTNYEEVVDPSTLDTDSSLSITRKYFVNGDETNVLKAGDLVEVQLIVSVPSDVSGIYSITDYLPSGLKLTHSDGWYYDQGQSISFGVGYSPYELNYYDKVEVEVEVEVETELYTSSSPDAAGGGSDAPYTETITYTARVINKGVFIAEPAVIQDAEDPSIMNVSGETGSVEIE